MATIQTNLTWGSLIDLSAVPGGALHLRLTTALREAVKDGRLPLGTSLPPSRALASDLRISRWTVTQAYGQLVTEGYLAARTGSATRVSWAPAADDDRFSGAATATPETTPRPPRFDLIPCRPDLRAFPRRRWVEAIRTAAETAPYDQFAYSEPGGQQRLRTVIAEHLNRSRGSAATPGTVTVFSGATQAMFHVSRALVAAGHTAIGIENPGSTALWRAARSAGLTLVPLPVDDQGLVVDALDAHPELRAVCVGAAHQVATGCVLAPSRRSALLNWARRVDGLVVEDDYDSEFTYDRPAMATMQGMDPDRVALLGSMTKTLSPTVQIGWVVAPRRWIESIREIDYAPLTPPALNQLALAHFMEAGAYDRHLRASRLRFRARRAALVAALARQLPDCRVRGAEAGLHLLIDLPAGTDAAAIVAEAGRRDMQLSELDEMRFRAEPGAPGLLLGYGNLRDGLVEEAVGVLAEVVGFVRGGGGA